MSQAKDLKYPCCVCHLAICPGSSGCPAANGAEKIYLKRLIQIINQDFPLAETQQFREEETIPLL